MELSDEFVDFTFIVPSGDPVEGFFAVTQPERPLRSISKTSNAFIVVTSKINSECFAPVDDFPLLTDVHND
jgi:hypothetical protein